MGLLLSTTVGLRVNSNNLIQVEKYYNVQLGLLTVTSISGVKAYFEVEALKFSRSPLQLLYVIVLECSLGTLIYVYIVRKNGINQGDI